MSSHLHTSEYHPIKAPRLPSKPDKSTDCFLFERLIGEGCIRQRLCLNLILNETHENLRCIRCIDYDPCIQTWINADTISCEYCEIHDIPVCVHAQDACGQNVCLPAMLELRIPLRVTRDVLHCCAILRRLLLNLEPICLINQCENTIQIRADLCAHLYLTCLEKQPICISPPASRCTFPPLYPQPCFNKKDRGFDE